MKKIIIIVLVSLVGCANVGSRFNVSEIESAPDGTAIIFFYRPSRFAAGAINMPVIANNLEIGTLDNGAYFKKVMSPGVYKIHSDSPAIDKISTISFEAGKKYFVRCSIGGNWVNAVTFINVPEGEAIPEIKETAVQL